MASIQRLPVSLTPLGVALEALLARLAPVAPVELALTEALGCAAAQMPPCGPLPPRDLATGDGWALRSRDLIGASSYSPLPLSTPPVWVEAGDPMPDDCDCVLDADSVDHAGAIYQVLAEATPGQGVCRAGQDVAAGNSPIAAGRIITPRDLLVARRAGLQRLSVRRPRLHMVNIPAPCGESVTAQLIFENARATGAEIVRTEAGGRDAASIAKALDADACDLIVTIGGTGLGRTDAAIAALAQRGEILAHGLALAPGRTAAIGRIGAIPVVALPGAPDHALGAWWVLALAALDRLAGRCPRLTLGLPLARKIASQVGLAEIALLERTDQAWIPLAVGDLSLAAIGRADAWLTVPDSSEGFAVGTVVDACIFMLRD
jgi:molybdopterin molybdotransferase